MLICCIPHALGVEDAFWLTVLGIIAAVATIVMFIAWISGKIVNAIKGKEKEIAELETDRKKAIEQRDENREKAKDLDDAISRADADVANAGSAEDAASLAYTAAAKAYNAAERDVQNKSTALSKATKDFDEHVKNCYDCQQMMSCSTADYLLYCKNAAWKALQYANRRLGIAKNNYNTAGSDWAQASNDLEDAKKSLMDLKQSKSNLDVAHGKLLTQIKTLDTQITAKTAERDAGKADLETINTAKTAAPEYIKSLNEAKKAGKDMEQWIEENPPPDSVKSAFDLIEKYAD